MSKFAVIIPAAGKSQRMGGIKKENIVLGSKTVLEHVKDAFSSFDQIIVVGPGGDCEGGATRSESVSNGLKLLRDDIDYVLVHDGARPFISSACINRVKDKLLSGSKAVVPCVKPKNTIRTKDASLNRDELFEVQTPQGFEKDLLKRAYQKALEEGFLPTDDAGVVEYFGEKIDIVEGDYANIKITTKDDIPGRLRYGNGYDLHKLVEGRPLMLGCTNIPYEKGLLGHSDADVLVHAICDALLGAAALGDIGRHFPDNDPKWEGVSGKTLLLEVKKILNDSGFEIECVDATLVAQRPKIAPHADEMRKRIAENLCIDVNNVSVKATTEEGLGKTGDGSCMAAFATATIKEV